MTDRIRALTLDLDNTLWDVKPVIARAERALTDWLGARYPRVAKRYTRELVAPLRERVIAAHPERDHDLTFLRKAVMRELAREAGEPETLVEEAFAVFERYRNEVDLYADALPALERLKRRYRIVAVTNGNADLRRIGIDHLFDEAIHAVTAGAAKPDPTIFEAAIAAARAEPSEILHVGDDPEADVAGARRAGLHAAWVNREAGRWPGHMPPPAIEVAHLGELDRLLAARAAAAAR